MALNARLMIPVLAAGILAASPQPQAQDSELENLGKELVKKRSRVDALSSEVDLAKGEVRDRVRALGLQKADLERQIKSLKLEISDLDSKVKKNEEEIARKEEPRGKLKPLVLRQISLAREAVAKGLPFKTQERLADLDRLRSQVEAGEIKPDEGLTRLWSAVEDELRLARENGLHRNPIELDGKSVLAEVARLGMVLLYFQTSDDRVGMVIPAADGKWTFTLVTDKEGRKQILYLFECLKKRIRHGYFELPNPYSAATPAQGR